MCLFLERIINRGLRYFRNEEEAELKKLSSYRQAGETLWLRHFTRYTLPQVPGYKPSVALQLLAREITRSAECLFLISQHATSKTVRRLPINILSHILASEIIQNYHNPTNSMSWLKQFDVAEGITKTPQQIQSLLLYKIATQMVYTAKQVAWEFENILSK